MNCLQKLEEHALRPKQAFYSRLKNENISDEDYTYYQRVWRDNNMKTMRDFLEWYNNRDVGPFLQAIAMQFDFYRQREIDMFKDGISVPGLTCCTYSMICRRRCISPSSMKQTKIYINYLKIISSVGQA
ncbi:hypothetical protein NP493_1808g00009 [Ridgeia piscesae]|uniref:Uncharacterized protein n=1 Tax=Ridgeia piscesae TaxID=27915 RepID=A0AAD9N7X2_RIDPI|nr:hypothetical protein NP493_1808g00009 [Ridgeia piscesae]